MRQFLTNSKSLIIIFALIFGLSVNSMCLSTITLSVDPTLGRVDYSSLSDQTLMELLVDGFDDETKKRYQDKDGMYLDVCKWSCAACDDDQRVIKVNIKTENVSGSLELYYVPPKVEYLFASSCRNGRLTGSVDLTQLPGGIQDVHLNRNRLTGEIDLTQLPDGMSCVYLQNNRLTGEINLTQLPDGMGYLYLQKNQLTGEIDLTQLPEGMVALNLTGNQKRMGYLHLQYNELTGKIDLTHLPDEMQQLHLENNQLTGEIDLTQLPREMEHLHLQNNRLTGEIDLTQLPDRIEELDLENNQLSGSFVVKRLPARMWFLNAQRNNFNDIAVVGSEVHAIKLCVIKLHGSGVTSVQDGNGNERYSKQCFT